MNPEHQEKIAQLQEQLDKALERRRVLLIDIDFRQTQLKESRWLSWQYRLHKDMLRIYEKELPRLNKDIHSISLDLKYWTAIGGVMPDKPSSLAHSPKGELLSPAPGEILRAHSPHALVPTPETSPIASYDGKPSGHLLEFFFPGFEAKLKANQASIANDIAAIRELERKDQAASTIHQHLMTIAQAEAENRLILLQFANEKGLPPESYVIYANARAAAEVEIHVLRQKHVFEMEAFERRTKAETEAYRERTEIEMGLEKLRLQNAQLLKEVSELSQIKVDEAKAEAELRTAKSNKQHTLDLIDYDRRTSSRQELEILDELEALYKRRDEIQKYVISAKAKKEQLEIVNERIRIKKEALDAARPRFVPDAHGKEPE